MHIVLHQPEIPANTGNIGRTCVAAGASLHLIEPLGFCLDEKSIRRAGMDYWKKLDVTRYINFEEFRETHPGARIWMATTKAGKCYTEADFGPEDYIMFGKESAGIPEELLVENQEYCIRIPMLPDIRSLNLSNSVAIVLYEALRQQGFPGLQEEGALHRLTWQETPRREDIPTGDTDAGLSAVICADVESAGDPHVGSAEGISPSRAVTGAACSETVRAAYLSPSACLSGDVTLAADTSVWHNATLRADDGPIRVGRGSNIQDNAVLHMDPGGEVDLGEYVTVGHGAILHGCRVGDNTLVGMGAIVMNHARIGCNCVIAAGALVTQGMEIPDNSLVMGSPGRVKRRVTEEEVRASRRNAEHYIEKAGKQYTRQGE